MIPNDAPRATLAAAVFVSLLTAFTLSAPPARAEDRNVKPNYDWVVEVNGAIDKTWQVLSAEQRNRIFLVSGKSDMMVLVSIADKGVRKVDRAMTMRHPDGSFDILAGAISPGTVIPLVVSGSTATFSLQGQEVTLKQRPPLLGPHSVDELVSDRPSFGEGIKNYQPDGSVVAFFRGYAKPTDIEVFFGSWCPVCENWVPKFLKAVQVSGNTKIQVKLIGLPRGFESDQDFARRKGLRGLPTFIILQDGIEVGRIVGAPDKGTVEAAIAEVLRAKS